MNSEHYVSALIDDACQSDGFEQWREQAKVHLRAALPCDGIYYSLFNPKVVADSPPFFGEYLANAAHYAPGMEKGRRAGIMHGHGFVDTEVYSTAERRRLPYFAELMLAHRITSQVVVMVRFANRPHGLITMVRSGGSAFTNDDLTFTTPLFRAVSVAQAAFIGRPSASTNVLERLSPRELAVAGFVSRGYQNLQIAAHLGTSIHTVRRQVESILRKTELGNRTELAVLMAEQPPLDAALRRVVRDIEAIS